MKFFDKLFSNKLEIKWEIDVNNFSIWKIFPSKSNILVCEIRNIDSKEMYLMGIDIDSGNLVFNNIKFIETWWIALETVVDDYIILHNYPKPDLPKAFGITVLNSINGKILWNEPRMRFIAGEGDIAYTQGLDNINEICYFKINLQNGNVIENYGQDLDSCRGFIEETSNSVIWDGWINSEVITTSDSKFNIIKEIISDNNTNQRGSISYLNYQNNSIIIVYEKSNKNVNAMLKNYLNVLLYIFNHEGKLIHKDLISENSVNTNEDLFFIWKENLIFLKNSNIISSISLQ